MVKNYRIWRKQPGKKWLAEIVEFIFVILPIIFVLHTFILNKYKVPTGSMETTMLVGELFIASKYADLWMRPLKHGDIISFNDPNFVYSDNAVKHWIEIYVWGPSNWTKRLIGMPGDHIEGKIEDGKPVVYRNGEKLDEPYVNKYPLMPVATKQNPSLQDLALGLARYSMRSYDPQRSFDDQPFYDINAQTICVIPNVPQLQIHEPQTPIDLYGTRMSDTFDVHLGENEYWAMGDNRLGSWDSRGWGKLSGDLIHGRILFRVFSIDSDESWMIIDLLKHPINFWKKIRWGRSLQWVH